MLVGRISFYFNAGIRGHKEGSPTGCFLRRRLRRQPPSCGARLPIQSDGMAEGNVRSRRVAPAEGWRSISANEPRASPALLVWFLAQAKNKRAAATAGWEVGLGRRQRPCGQARRGCGSRSGKGAAVMPEPAVLFRQDEGVRRISCPMGTT